jgi:hypothetical protein
MMDTNELIAALSIDSIRPPAPGRALTRALIPAVAIAVCLFLATLGLRPHFLSLLGEPRFLFKLLLLDLLAALAGALVLRLFRPGAVPRAAVLALAIPPILLALAIGAELVAVPATQWGARLVGSNSMVCLRSIPFLGFAPLIATLLALRYGAPERPALAGAAAGLFAGAIGAAIYATHCPDDSPLFVAVWYPIAIAFMTAVGAMLGARLLRW